MAFGPYGFESRPRHSAESPLTFAEEFERRDADVAHALLGVERLQVEVEELRAHASAAGAFLEGLRGGGARTPTGARRPARGGILGGAVRAKLMRSSSTTVQPAASKRRASQRAVELAPRVRDVPAGSPNLEGALEWASRARGALLLQRSALARERDEVVREATERLAHALGEPAS